ncbi:MAG: tetratricopeptide repeat protein [Pirellulaceae bacterium]
MNTNAKTAIIVIVMFMITYSFVSMMITNLASYGVQLGTRSPIRSVAHESDELWSQPADQRRTSPSETSRPKTKTKPGDSGLLYPTMESTFNTFEIPKAWTVEERRLMKQLQGLDITQDIDLVSANPQRVLVAVEYFVMREDPDALLILGTLKVNGWLVERDTISGLELLKKAGDLGNDKAKFAHSATVLCGLSEPEDQDAALQVIRQIVSSGRAECPVLAECQLLLATINRVDPETEEIPGESARLYFLAIKATPKYEAFIPDLMTAAGEANVTGELAAEMFEFLNKRAHKGSGKAMLGLGMAYEKGILVSKHTAKSMNWYDKAIELEVPEAFTAMGRIIMERSVKSFNDNEISREEYEQQKTLSRSLLSRGAALGDENAKSML